MRKVLLFIKDKPAELIDVRPYERKINCIYPGAVVRSLAIEIAFVTFSNGKCGAISFVADRYVSQMHLLEAYNKLVLNNEE